MSHPTEEQILAFLDDHYRLWNEGRVEEMIAVFRAIAPGGVTVQSQYHGPREVGEAMRDMFEKVAARKRFRSRSRTPSSKGASRSSTPITG